MFEVLTELGIHEKVQFFFRGMFTVDAGGLLTFCYGQHTELFGPDYHRVPATTLTWIAGDLTLNSTRTLVICSSAMDAIAFLSANFGSYQRIDQLLFISVGLLVCQSHIDLIRTISFGRKVCLVMPGHVLGAISDIKLAIGICGYRVTVRIEPEGFVNINFRNQVYNFKPDELSLSAFEKKTKFRSRIRTYKAKQGSGFLNLIQGEING